MRSLLPAAVALLLGSIPLFLGLAVVMPILAHATWHLYRRVVEAGHAPRPEYRPRVKTPRYAADFPAALFPTRSVADQPSEAAAPGAATDETSPKQGSDVTPPSV